MYITNDFFVNYQLPCIVLTKDEYKTIYSLIT